MAKKVVYSSPRKWPVLLFFALASLGVLWAMKTPFFENWKDRALQYVDNRGIHTFEARFLPEQIVEAHSQELLGNGKKTLQNTTLKYYPYLLFNVKYLDQTKTKEGLLLWGLNDGEMVLNTEHWEKSHGFGDCLDCKATRSDFKVLHAIARHQGSHSIEELQKELHLEKDTLDAWTSQAKEKHLVLQKGNLLQLHFENPHILVSPTTKIKQSIVSKPIGEGQKIDRSYSRREIIALTEAAFGPDFKIRSEQEVFLPVYSFEILNPDGSVQVSEWNALTGKHHSLQFK